MSGAVGLTKAALGIDAVPDQVLLARRDKCRRCDYATKSEKSKFAANGGLTTLSVCVKCSCNIAAKTKVGSEACPIGLWDQFPPRL